MGKQQIGSVYINLSVCDLAKTRAFWEARFAFNEQFTDENALCSVLREGAIGAMLHRPGLFSAAFTTRAIADGTTTQVLLAVQVESRARVEIVQTAPKMARRVTCPPRIMDGCTMTVFPTRTGTVEISLWMRARSRRIRDQYPGESRRTLRMEPSAQGIASQACMKISARRGEK